MNKMKGHGGRPKVSVSAPTAKDIKEAAWNRSLRLYVMNPERMQAFEEAIINEYRESIERKVTGMDVLGADGCTWGDTVYDSNAVAYGYNTALDEVKSVIINEKPTT